MKQDTYILGKFENWDILEQMLPIETPTAVNTELHLCSFAMAEGYARRLLKLQEQFSKLFIYLDFTVASRNRANLLFIQNLADEVYLCNTHAKLILYKSENYQAVAVLSANATMNHRYESAIISTRPEAVTILYQQLISMQNDALRLQ